jgi:hypothetical protein
MTYNDNIRELKSLIEDYESETRRLEEMIDLWENHDDPCSDPGLQYEQENKAEAAYNKIVKFCATLLSEYANKNHDIMKLS